MSSYDARLRLKGRSKIPLSVEVDVTDERLVLVSGDRTLGNWTLNEVDIASLPDGFHLKVDGEEVVLTVADPEQFLTEVTAGKRAAAEVVPTISDGRHENEPGPPLGQGGADPEGERFYDLERRVSELSAALTAEQLSPADAFGQWLGLLKEINHRHGHGTLPSPVFHQLNTRLLELFPD